MDASKFNSKLRQTFKVLFIDNKTPHDDTLLEKFTTLLETKLNENSDESERLIESMNAVPWIKTLLDNWKMFDSSVAAFGFNVLGIFVSSRNLYRNLAFKCQTDALRTCLDDLLQDFADLPALLRFSTLKLLHKLTVARTSHLFLPAVTSDLPLNSLTDDSIFVARAAKEFVLYNLVDVLGRIQSQGSQSDSQDSSELTKTVNHLLTLTKGDYADPKAKRKAIVVLNLLQEACLRSPMAVPHLISSTTLKLTLMGIIENTDDEDVCAACSHLLLLLIDCRSTANISQEWLAVVDVLIENQQFVCVAKFATLTGERWSENNTEVSKIFKSILLRPLILSVHWQSTRQLPWLKGYDDNWNKALNVLSTNSNHQVLSKLINCILANLPKLHKCFQNNVERFALLDLLLFILSNFETYGSYPVKMRNITVDSILGILTNWGSDWLLHLPAEDRDKLLDSSITILNKYATPPSLMIKTMKIVQLLIKTCHFQSATNWDTSVVKLNEIVHTRCHDLQWEVRDSAFEILAEMAKLAKDHSHLQEWLKKSGSMNLVVIALDDTEGYVRASALQVFTNFPEIICKQQEIVDVDVTVKIMPIEIIIQILLQDSEGITRRAAITTLVECYKEDQILPTYIDHLYKAMVIASMDLDWEVKLTVINFWDTLLSNVLSNASGEADKFNFLRKTGFCDAAVSLTEDEDVTVQHKMAHLMKRLQESFCTSLANCHPSSIPIPDTCSNNDESEGSSSKITAREEVDVAASMYTEEQKLLEIEKVLDTRDCVTVENIMISQESSNNRANWLQGSKVDLDELLAKHHHARVHISQSEFVHWLHELNVEAILFQTDLTTDLYHANPQALLDDILLDNYESGNEEEIAMDCY